MIKPVPTACTLACDNCNQELNIGTRHVFKSPAQALALAQQCGWQVNEEGKALCPSCKNIK